MPSTKDNRTGSSNYRKPPVANQFKKGASGNPKGRPRKKAVPGFGALGGGIADRFGAMALDEATRPVTVREGDEVSEIPAMQALIRTMFRAAAQGDTRAGRQLLEVTARAESERTRVAMKALEHAIQWKQKYGPIFEQREREGLDPPDIYPHPDDVIINETGEVRYDGPISKEHAAARKAVREEADELTRRYRATEAAVAKVPPNPTLRRDLQKLKKYYEFKMKKYNEILKEDSERIQRHEALRLLRRANETKSPEPDSAISPEPNTAIAGSKHEE
jgi:Family of unknown function (DUF5681)